MLSPWLPGAFLHPPLNLGQLGVSVCVGAILKPFSTAPSHAARCYPGAFPIHLLSEVDVVGLGMLPALLSWRMRGC